MATLSYLSVGMLALEQNLNHLCELSSASSSVKVEDQPSQKTTLHPNRTNAAHSHSNIALLAAKRYGLIGITLVTYARTLHRAFYIWTTEIQSTPSCRQKKS